MTLILLHALPALASMVSPALHLLRDEGHLTGLSMVDPFLWVCRPRAPREVPNDHIPGEPFGGWNDLARKLSCLLGGQWRGNASGVSWLYNREALWLTSPNLVPSLYDARCAVHSITQEEPLPWSIPGLSRRLLAWTEIEDTAPGSGSILKAGVKHHYQFCTPKTAPRATLYDVKSCYATLLDRMPSPLLDLVLEQHRVIFRRLPLVQERRWRKIQEAAYAHKLLRNCLVGSMTGGSRCGHYWHRGEKKYSRPVAGPLRPAGLLVARTAYELLAEVVERAHGAAIYGNVDSVILEHGGDDTYALDPYRRYGLEVQRLAEGETEVCSVGVYRVGIVPHNGPCTPLCKGRHKQTKWYEAGCRHSGELAPAVIASVGGPVWGRWLDRTKTR
jgi:hypothetical protein